MATANKGDFPLPQDGYLVFDSLGLKAHLKNRLTENGVYTDQAYEGSNLSEIINILAFTFNGLIYYLNRTSTESTYADTQIYENMNRLVKLVGYNPVGRQSSILTFGCSAMAELPIGLYTIPRYSYINLGSSSYSFNEDITFYKATAGVEFLQDMSESKLFYQGRFIEYTPYNATGDENEITYLLPGDNVIIDHFNIEVYVKDVVSEQWSKWERTPSLYLTTAKEKKYEVRLNENKHYEIKFGNNINGQKLNPNDTVAIYYLKSDGSSGQVGANALLAGKLILFNTTQFNEIYSDIIVDEVTLITSEQALSLSYDNASSSTYYAPEETVDQIRQNAPNLFRSQYRLVTESDFENYVKTNYSNLIHDVKVVNNWSYLANYLKYYYDLGITNPNNVSRVLFNQVQFADSCNFNNVYMFIVSKIASDAINQASFLSPALKSLIISSIQDIKLLTCEPMIIDPVYIGLDIGMAKSGVTPTLDDINNSELLVIQKTNSKRDTSAIQTDITNLFLDYFNRNNCSLGQTIDIDYLNNAILAIEGVDTFYTRRTDDTTVQYQGLSMIAWNPIYPTDKRFVTQNLVMPAFQFPFLNSRSTFDGKINVQTSYTIFENIEY